MKLLFIAIILCASSALPSEGKWLANLAGRDVDHPGNEKVQLKDRDYGFLNSGGYDNGGGGGGGIGGGGLWDDDSWPLKKRWLKFDKQRSVDHPGNEKVQLKDRDYGFLNSGGYDNGGGGGGGLWDDDGWKRAINTLRKFDKQRSVDHPGNEKVQLKDRDYGFLNSGGYDNGGGGGGGLWDDDGWKRGINTLRKVFSDRKRAMDAAALDLESRDYIEAVWGSNPWATDTQPSDPWGSNPWGTGTGGGIWESDWPHKRKARQQ